ncbi:SURF1 family protein [Aeromicrobium piscarium]|uniref:SURF1-like protein n=1 Tax=Aeromicrobium piscarium TaxID=2590901 RepID=A0A554RIC0_9ACTN|nr:SURF1 family protein [Aeromicrobium piscarium]TSD53780.1 SURF1 family protein [Aeromicrobium piscarium]
MTGERPLSTWRLWFRPSMIGLHAFAILAIAVCVVAGSWQLGVYDARQSEQRADVQEVPTAPLDEVWGPDDVFTSVQQRRPVTVTGQFRPAEEQIWVTDQEQAGEGEGSWLVAPVMVDGSALLVVRGWTAEEPDSFPDVPQGMVTFDGVLQPSDTPAGRFDPETRTIGSVRVQTLINELPYDLWSGYALGEDEAIVPAGFAAPAIPEPEVSWTAGGRNLGYGLQWWVFGGFVVFMWWRMGRESVETARSALDRGDTLTT